MNIFRKVLSKLPQTPEGLSVLFFTEMWELFARFAVMSLLVLYVTKFFHVLDAHAFEMFSGFLALYWVTPILGGYLADHFLGHKHAIVLGGIIMSAGCYIMAVPHLNVVYYGLAMVTMGSGFFSPSLAALLGELYSKNSNGRDAGFTFYHIAKNLGALLAPIICGYVAHKYQYNYGFAIAGIGVTIGVVNFCFRHKKIKIQNQLQPKNINAKLFGIPARFYIYAGSLLLVPFLQFVLVDAFQGELLAAGTIVAVIVVIVIAIKQGPVVRNHLLAILIMLLFVTLFQANENQGGSTLTLFIDRIVNRHAFGMVLPTSFYFTLNPIFMFIAGPMLASFWISLGKQKREPNEVSKFIFALVLLGLGFVVFGFAGHAAMQHGLVSSWYVVLAYFLFPVAELCMIPIALSLVTRLAPERYKAMMVGIFMLACSASSYLTEIISKPGQIKHPINTLAQIKDAAGIYQHLFFECAIMLMVGAIILLLLKPVIERLIASSKTPS